ncbi:MAG: hypothetical protein NC038_00050 [Paludibacter sp.]|nr:hypothetical protein [Bacteroidales bacterium]MCM1068769.1 hypothetical protein [Prevotella sp.]MCM1354481.1 hypothetical protein [Bacteroides sp.]MCM1443284.1 hypothetical protein [Muribaculum sp.]MCM1481031.1 hypothetical protein [Paludibacter sp.]
MTHNILLIIIGFILWNFIPGKITAGSKKIRPYIDLGAQILGILLMLTGGINMIKLIIS